MERLLSIVIPVYNVKKYLEECINSILIQSNEKCEIVLVDDGSTDGSGMICDKYSDDGLISVIHQENRGLAGARNSGLQKASGEYVMFIDSDDRISPNSIPIIIQSLMNEQCDLFFLQGIKFYPDGYEEPLGDEIWKNYLYQKNKEEVIEYLSNRPKYPGSACTKIYKRNFLNRNNICFPDDRRHSEDLGFVLDCIINAETYSAIDKVIYEYRQNREGSITSALSAKSFWDLTKFVDESIKKLFIQGSPTELNQKNLLSFVAYEFAVMLWHYTALSKEEKTKGREYIKRNKWVLDYSKSIKFRLIGKSLSVLGIDMTIVLLNFYKNKR